MKYLYVLIFIMLTSITSLCGQDLKHQMISAQGASISMNKLVLFAL